MFFEDVSEHTKCSLLTSPVDIQPVHIFFGLTVFPKVFGMSVPFIARVSGPLVEEKVCISQCSGEILWPTKNIYEVAFGGDTNRQYLQVLDKSVTPIEQVYTEIFGCQAPRLAVP